jgi:hypothetical protein
MIKGIDWLIVLSAYLSPQSRIQLWRSVEQSIARSAPFLALDRVRHPESLGKACKQPSSSMSWRAGEIANSFPARRALH